MDLSPTERRMVLEMIAARIVDELRAQVGGDFAEMIVLPISAVSQVVGLSATRLKDKLPVTECASGKHGVTIAHIRTYVRKRTRYPKGQTAADWEGVAAA